MLDSHIAVCSTLIALWFFFFTKSCHPNLILDRPLLNVGNFNPLIFSESDAIKLQGPAIKLFSHYLSTFLFSCLFHLLNPLKNCCNYPSLSSPVLSPILYIVDFALAACVKSTGLPHGSDRSAVLDTNRLSLCLWFISAAGVFKLPLNLQHITCFSIAGFNGRIKL